LNKERIHKLTVKDKIHSIIKKSLASAIKDGRLPEGEYPEIKVQYPTEQKFGDYATPFALESAKIVRKSPLQTGEILKEYIENNDIKNIISKVEIVKPGFINIFISLDCLYSNLKAAIEQKDNYGKQKKDSPRNINIEFVSANPTGPLNIVSARAAALGDTLANLLEATGENVDREFYVNDYGNQFFLLGKSVLARLKELKGEDIEFPAEGYHGEYIIDIARYADENFSDQVEKFETENELIEFLANRAVDYNLERQKKALVNFNINFKTWFHERVLHEKGEVLNTLDYLKSKEVIYVSENKTFFRSTDYKDDKDRVIVRDDGRPTYLLADIAYHRDKTSRGYDQIIDIWGPDHHGYIARLSGAMKAMGNAEKNFKVLIAQQVNLVMEGETVKMSKRLGKFSTMEELIEEIGVDVARYFFVMRSMDSHLDFDLALAKKNSSENPVFYLQYAHARICSIFREAKKRNISYDSGKSSSAELDHSESVNLLKLILKFPEEISDAAENYEPHRIATYLLKLAQGFHKFYTEHRILSEDLQKTNSFLALSDATRNVMRNGLTLLGVSSPDKM